MIDRYIYAVTKELPKKSRDDTADQLRVLINDKVDQVDDSLTEEEKMDRVLRELGEPKKLANTYRGRERYLIGPKYYDKYLGVVKGVVLSIFIGLSIATGLSVLFFRGSDATIPGMIGAYITSLFSAALQGTAWVTGIFALLEYYEISLGNDKEEGFWEPAQLPQLPEKKELISRGESIFSIMVATIFLTLFFFLPEKVGIYFTGGSGWNFIPLFNWEVLASFKIIIFLVFTLNILIELIKIIKGRWTLKIAFITTLLNITSATLFISLISNMTMWNSEMVQQFEQYLPISYERVIFLISAVIIIATIGESISSLYKGIKYGGETI